VFAAIIAQSMNRGQIPNELRDWPYRQVEGHADEPQHDDPRKRGGA
jgi:hypothetical protein